MSNEEKELTAKATSEELDNPLLDHCWFQEAVAAYEAKLEQEDDYEYVECSYCCAPTLNNSGICTRCLKEQGQLE